MQRMFTFDPERYAADYAARDYVHIPQGLTEAYYDVLCRQIDEHRRGKVLKEFALGNKEQSLYEFPDDEHLREFLRVVGGVCGLDPEKLVISERHIKSYEADANPYPLAHKDRFATELSVGFSVRVPEGSTLVLYPEDEREVNPFNSSAELRASLSPEAVPEVTLRGARRVEIRDRPRDVILFQGNAIWHLRERPANTVMLYFKLNAFNCDPIGEDPASPAVRERTLRFLAADDEALAHLVPLLGRRVDHVHRRWNHHWEETLGVVLWGEKHYTIDEQELKALRLLDGRRSLGQVVEAAAGPGQRPPLVKKLRRLAERGVIDLSPAATRDDAGPAGRAEQGRTEEPACAVASA